MCPLLKKQFNKNYFLCLLFLTGTNFIEKNADLKYNFYKKIAELMCFGKIKSAGGNVYHVSKKNLR